MMADDPRHGSPAGRVQHRKDGERPCIPCADAHRDYMRAWRSDPEHRRQTNLVNSAASRALWLLKDQHRDEYDALYAEQLAILRNES